MIGYVGSFSPPYGGVTVKNDLWFGELKKKNKITKIEISNNPIFLLKNLVKFIFCTKFIIGVGSTKKRILFTKLLDKFFPHKLTKSVIFIMGGTFADDIVKNDKALEYFKKYKGIFVELKSMKEKLESRGCKNVYLVPNCRKRPTKKYDVRNNDRLQCVCFSILAPEKGIDLVLEASKKLPNVDFTFWGEIKKDYECIFLEQVKKYENCSYGGVYKNDGENVYDLLNKYDLLLLPTRWKHESMIASITESKIAGIPSIVSNIAYNTELVKHMFDGIIMNTYEVNELVNAINIVDKDREFLMEMKRNTQKDLDKFFIDVYIDDVVDVINPREN